MTLEKDYHRIGCCIADVIGVVAPLSDEQRVMLVGATSPWLDQRDKRIAELEFLLERAKVVARGCVEVMEMQEKRERGEFHIPAHTFGPMWDSAKLKAREL